MAAGLLIAAMVVLLGGYVVQRSAPVWTASTQILLVPSTQQASSTTSDLYDTLSAGQVVSTAAALLQQPRLLEEAVADAGVGSDPAITAVASVVTETAIVEIRVTAPSRSAAVEVADAYQQAGVSVVSDRLAPFLAEPLGDASDTVDGSRDGQRRQFVLVLFGALVAGVVVQRLLRPRRP